MLYAIRVIKGCKGDIKNEIGVRSLHINEAYQKLEWRMGKGKELCSTKPCLYEAVIEEQV